MENYFKWLNKNGYSKNTIITYKIILKKYSDSLNDIRNIKTRILLVENANTAWTEYNIIISYMKFSKDKRINSLKELKLKPIPVIFKKVFSKEYLYDKTKDLLDYKCVIIRILFETGIRASEIKTIKDINEKTLRVIGKGRKEREVFHNFETMKFFKGFNKSVKTLRIWVKDILGEDFTPHSIRRSHATHLLTKGANIKTVMLQLGHSKIETTYKYLQLSQKENLKIYKKYF